MTTLNNVDEKLDSLTWREQNLKLTKWCLERYSTTQDEEYLTWAKTFGEWSRKIKEEYLTK